MVERLLASPAYGERWARHWLDLVRFAETCAATSSTSTSPRPTATATTSSAPSTPTYPTTSSSASTSPATCCRRPRRKPDDGTNESILGTGFWFFGEGKHSPVDIRADGDERRDNMIDVFSKTFLGLTVACARCHDHKFDAISTRDYYALAGYLQSSRQQLAFIDPPERIGKPLAALRCSSPRRGGRQSPAQLQVFDGAGAGPGGALLDGRIRPDPKKPGELFQPWQRLTAVKRTPAAFTRGRQAPSLLAKPSPRTNPVQLFADFRRDDYRDWSVTGDAFGTAPAKPAYPFWTSTVLSR